MSNIKKITANRKKRKEKGTRADFVGSNPHSNGDVFSRSLLARRFKNHDREKRADLISRDISRRIRECFIPSGDESHLRVKSLMLLKASKGDIGFVKP